MAGSLDRAVDVAATLELRGYSLEPPRRHTLLEAFPPLWGAQSFIKRSRYDARFYVIGGIVLIAAIAAKVLGADGFHAYPTIEVGFGPATLVLSVLIVLSGLAPRRGNA
jgi:hypothetical protein